jgi:manganese catalase
MILRYDRLGVDIPAGDPDPAGATVVQELMGGRFGEMSTLMNYSSSRSASAAGTSCARSTT